MFMFMIQRSYPATILREKHYYCLYFSHLFFSSGSIQKKRYVNTQSTDLVSLTFGIIRRSSVVWATVMDNNIFTTIS
jgi:hypothetical protein